MRIAIAGGGIGGLALALALHERGMRPTIHERQDAVRELGVGINILPHAIRHLARWGLLPGLDRIGIRTRWLVYETADGRDILRQPRGLDAGFDAPQFSIHRGKLLALLHEAVRERLGEGAVRTGERLTDHASDADGAWARFETASGPREVRADVLVGADGIHSAIRRARRPDEGPPRWNGVVMWRGARWTTPFGDGRTMIIAGGMRSKLVLYPVHDDPARPGETLMNWVICAKVAEPSDPLPHCDDWQGSGALSDVMEHVRGRIAIPELDVTALIEGTDGIWVYPMCDRDPLERWTEGRVTLLGDAAHAMYPVGSNGASQAVLDAVSLAGHLAERGVAGLSAYEAERRPATAEIVRANRGGGPERVIDLVEERAPGGFERLEDVATEDELRAIVGDYQSMAGFDAARA